MAKKVKNQEKKTQLGASSHKSFKLIVIAGTILIVLFIVGFFVTRIRSTKEYESKIPTQEIEDVKCLKKGNVCSADEIIDGIKVRIKVNDKETYDFYLISNDGEEATYIMSENLKTKSNWSGEMINFKGPSEALYKMGVDTSDWKNIPIIEDYTYEDEGIALYKAICEDKTFEYKDYDCTKYAGYNGLEIKHGKVTLKYNLPPLDGEGLPEEIEIPTSGSIDGIYLRSRLLTKADYSYLVKKDIGPSWLIDNMKRGEYYWTLSSDVSVGNDYILSAYVIENVDNKAENITEYVMSNNMDPSLEAVGYNRPVITLEKK